MGYRRQNHDPAGLGAGQCKSDASRVVIATDDQRIEDAARAFGAEVCMTDPEHLSGTDWLQQVASILGLDDEQILVNVQGMSRLFPGSNQSGCRQPG